MDHQEYLKLIDLVFRYDDLLITIKGWSVTLGIAILGYAFKSNSRRILLLALISSFCFTTIDAKYKQYQENYYGRINELECLLGEIKNVDSQVYIAPKINSAWFESHNISGFFRQFKKMNIYLPHGIIFLIALGAFIVMKKEATSE